jgi:ribose transport system substrate-binding protein
MKRYGWLVGLLVIAAALACGKPGGGAGRARVALIMKAVTNRFFGEMEKGGKAAAERLGVNLQALSVPRETDYEQQARLVENVVAQGVGAIVIAPADSKGIVAPLLKAQANGIHVVNIDNRIDTATAQAQGLKVLTFIGPDNAEGAEKSTEYLIGRIGGKGSVAMLEGIRGADNAEKRKVGFLRAVAKHPEVKVAESVSANWESDMAQQMMAGILNRHADLAGVFCANDNMALGAIAAIDAAGLTGKVRVAGYDNLDAARKMILAGKMDATIEQHPYRMGEMGVEAALRAIKGEPVEPLIRVPTDLITSETLKAKK